MNLSKSQISRSYTEFFWMPWLLSTFFYWLALFPARIGPDTNAILILMKSEESTSQWTSLYFRFFQVISINGHAVYIASLLSLLVLAFSFEILIRSLTSSTKVAFFTRCILSLSPFFGVFGMTLDHQLFTTAGTLNVVCLLIHKKRKFKFDIWLNHVMENRIFILLSLFLLQMTFQGVVISIVFSILFFSLAKSSMISLFILLATTSSPQLLNTESGSTLYSSALKDLRLAPILGDIKCVVQHNKVFLTASEKNILENLSPISNWREPKPCLLADHAFFALNGSSVYEKDLIKLWLRLIKDYPQIVLTAHLQRSSVALPPPFFRGQPNMMPTNDLEAPSTNLSLELQQWSELFKTSIDNSEYKENRSLINRLLEPTALVGAFFFNQNSQFWGWGGLWLMVFLLLGFFGKFIDGFGIVSTFPLITLSVLLFCISPAPSPRYAMPQILIGITCSLVYAIRSVVSEN
jgi:hypothetical protein